MSTFKYVVKNKDSRTIAGKIAAESKTAVIEELRKREFVIISIDEIKEAAAKQKAFRSKESQG